MEFIVYQGHIFFKVPKEKAIYTMIANRLLGQLMVMREVKKKKDVKVLSGF